MNPEWEAFQALLLFELARQLEAKRRLLEMGCLDERRRRMVLDFVRRAEALLRSSRRVQ
ncbi:MAG: hypothetical protein K2X87_19935 [Gemmataceae bacterium]|nr:hypothetical protein [Gemmataceae bacterium]